MSIQIIGNYDLKHNHQIDIFFILIGIEESGLWVTEASSVYWVLGAEDSLRPPQRILGPKRNQNRVKVSAVVSLSASNAADV